MRRLNLWPWQSLREATLQKLRHNSPASRWFPGLQGLVWPVSRWSIPYIDLFFSPHLRNISIFLSWSGGSEIPCDVLPAIASAISALPTSALRCLRVVDNHTASWVGLEDSLSCLVLRCGPSLTMFSSSIPLSNAAMNHLMQLPALCMWYVRCPPPTYFSL